MPSALSSDNFLLSGFSYWRHFTWTDLYNVCPFCSWLYLSLYLIFKTTDISLKISIFDFSKLLKSKIATSFKWHIIMNCLNRVKLKRDPEWLNVGPSSSQPKHCSCPPKASQELGQSLCFQSVAFSWIYLFSSCLSIGTSFGSRPMLFLWLAFVYEHWYPGLLLYQYNIRLAP